MITVTCIINLFNDNCHQSYQPFKDILKGDFNDNCHQHHQPYYQFNKDYYHQALNMYDNSQCLAYFARLQLLLFFSSVMIIILRYCYAFAHL